MLRISSITSASSSPPWWNKVNDEACEFDLPAIDEEEEEEDIADEPLLLSHHQSRVSRTSRTTTNLRDLLSASHRNRTRATSQHQRRTLALCVLVAIKVAIATLLLVAVLAAAIAILARWHHNSGNHAGLHSFLLRGSNNNNSTKTTKPWIKESQVEAATHLLPPRGLRRLFTGQELGNEEPFEATSTPNIRSILNNDKASRGSGQRDLVLAPGPPDAGIPPRGPIHGSPGIAEESKSKRNDVDDPSQTLSTAATTTQHSGNRRAMVDDMVLGELGVLSHDGNDGDVLFPVAQENQGIPIPPTTATTTSAQAPTTATTEAPPN